MFYQTKKLKKYNLNSLDGKTGSIKEFYFNDRYWTISYLVANTGHWLANRQVLISPKAILGINKENHCMNINLTKQKIEDSPSLDNDKPISRQYEEYYNCYYRWPEYWYNGQYMWGPYSYITRRDDKLFETVQTEKKWSPNLRSTREVSGYIVQAIDGKIGHVDDFIINCETWAIHYLVINTHNWLPGKKVLILSRWIDNINWINSIVTIKLTRNIIKQLPEYTVESMLQQDYETQLHWH